MKKEGGRDNSNSQSEIPLRIGSYDDMFSSLDPRPYSHKALSGDFLSECKKASIEKKKVDEIKLFLPKSKRNVVEETKIKERLKEHFNKHFTEKRKEINRIKMNGASWFVVGSIIIVLTAVFVENPNSMFLKVLINISHPAGWFFLWEGLGKIILFSHEKIPEYTFYKKMDRAKVTFLNW